MKLYANSKPIINIPGLEYMNINVKLYGAVGDGVTNDDEPISKADALGKHLFFPPGRYLLTEPPKNKCYSLPTMV